MTQKIVAQKTKLEQMKARLAAEEVKLKIKAQKQQTKDLIELGKLVVRTGLTPLPLDALYGALLSLKDSLGKEDGDSILKQWAKIGKIAFDKDKKTATTGVIITFEAEAPQEAKAHLKQHGLKWNSIRKEWYGHAQDLDQLKGGLSGAKHELVIV